MTPWVFYMIIGHEHLGPRPWYHMIPWAKSIKSHHQVILVHREYHLISPIRYHEMGDDLMTWGVSGDLTLLLVKRASSKDINGICKEDKHKNKF